MLRTLSKLGIERNFFNWVKSGYQKTPQQTLYLLVKTECFHCAIRNKADCFLSQIGRKYLQNIYLIKDLYP